MLAFLGVGNDGYGRGKLTIDGLALCQVAVVLASEQAVAVPTHDALDVAVSQVRECA
jgi:hypothetical protein